VVAWIAAACRKALRLMQFSRGFRP